MNAWKALRCPAPDTTHKLVPHIMPDRDMIKTPSRTRLILVADTALDAFGSRTHEGLQLKFEWGEQHKEGWYIPTLTSVDDGWLASVKRTAYDEGYHDGIIEQGGTHGDKS